MSREEKDRKGAALCPGALVPTLQGGCRRPSSSICLGPVRGQARARSQSDFKVFALSTTSGGLPSTGARNKVTRNMHTHTLPPHGSALWGPAGQSLWKDLQEAYFQGGLCQAVQTHDFANIKVSEVPVYAPQVLTTLGPGSEPFSGPQRSRALPVGPHGRQLGAAAQEPGAGPP